METYINNMFNADTHKGTKNKGFIVSYEPLKLFVFVLLKTTDSKV
jgi:hypothetical protein